MKELKFSFLALAAAAAMVSCKNPATDATVTQEEQVVAEQTGTNYTADATTSVIKWKATHKGGFAPRFGTLNLSSGNFAVENGAITGGEFVVNMNSLVVDPTSVSEPDKKPADLEGHLKNADFFDVEKYPEAKFQITNVVPFDATKDKSILENPTSIVSGNLTLLDKTVNVTFPAIVTVTDTEASLVANFDVDRTSWNINFGAEGNPADWGISKDINIALDVKAKK